MELNRLEAKLYSTDIVTEPMLEAWEASFDDGVTWSPGEAADGGFRWLVAGADAEPEDQADAVAVIDRYTVPLLRDIDNPETVIVRGPPIRYRH